MHTCLRRAAAGLLLIASVACVAAADDAVLIDPAEPLKGWTFGNGPEFPGAKGGMAPEPEADAQHRPALRLEGDFTGGGNYVQLGRDLPPMDVDALSFWLKAPLGLKALTVRLIDAGGRCHQLSLRTEPHGDWQRIVFPVARYFEKAGTSASVESVLRYESWGGTQDGRWTNPAKALYILVGRDAFGEARRGSVLIAGARLQAAAPKVTVMKEVRLDDLLSEGELDWTFNDGREFPGARGGVSLVANEPAQGAAAIRFRGDFTGGGAYVSTDRRLNGLDVKAIRMRVKTSNVTSFNVRLGDGSGQCHQGRGFRLNPDGQWHDVTIETAAVTGGEHWGGANDGKWHGRGQYVSLLLSKGSSADLQPELLITDLRAEAEITAAVAGQPYRESFDASPGLPRDWTFKGPAASVVIASDQPFDGSRLLQITRPEAQLGEAVEVTGASFPAGPGPWSFAGATRSSLHSPDNSYAVSLRIEALNAAGQVIEQRTLVDQTGTKGWKAFSRQVELPAATARARFAASMLKTHGTAGIDGLTATPLEAAGEERIVERIVIGSSALGNLFLPEQEMAFNVEVQSSRPLPHGQRAAIVTVTDYWGAEQQASQTVPLERNGMVQQRFRYTGRIIVPSADIEVGKYHELHVALPLKGYEDASEYSGFAALPEAESRRYAPERIPFTIRNWDSRIGEYHQLASRIGHRTIGLWGASGVQTVLRQGNLWYSGSQAAEVERHGFKNISEEKLFNDTAAFVRQHGTNGMACLVMGNEPNERPEGIPEKVRAYKLVYEAVKSVNPKLPVVATSVPPNEHFWEAGYHRYCDIFDFHVYETYDNVRQTIRRYRELMKKYGVDKPVWCTELGLNSQGQTRHAVAQEVVKKITAFLAEGGASVSWFTILYPDHDGKARGTSGDAHNVFDCQYSKYNPRLDAIMYYHMINGITVKKIVDEVQHADGVQSYLFRDEENDCLQVLWHENSRVDRGIPLPGVEEVRLIRIDGSSTTLSPRDGAVSLGLSSEPVLLRYRQAPTGLARTLAPPALTVPAQPLEVLKGASLDLAVSGPGLEAAELQAVLPPRWRAELRQVGTDAVTCRISAPAETEARTGRVMLQRRRGSERPSAEVALSVAIMSPISVEIRAAGRGGDGEPDIAVALMNHGTEPKSVNWSVELADSWAIAGGGFRLNEPGQLKAYLKGENEGRAVLEPSGSRTARVRIADAGVQTLYRLAVSVTDDTGRRVVRERLAGGFATAASAAGPIAIDGRLDEAAWAKAQPESMDQAEQVLYLDRRDRWGGAADLSGRWRALWDEHHLYLGFDVTDDAAVAPHADGSIWNQDGLQFLFDPTRTLAEKAGKYDYSMGVGSKGPQAWCHLSAHSSVPEGAVPEIRVAAQPLAGSAGGRSYEIAIPWSRLAPFAPKAGANLGLAVLINDDDGSGRKNAIGWFGGVHSKELDQVGDLLLAP